MTMTPRPYVCAGIEYGDGIHSDICPPECEPGRMDSAEWRRFLHTNLDEWLDKSDGTGHFVIGGASLWDALNNGRD
jgi:hypothetical protein